MLNTTFKQIYCKWAITLLIAGIVSLASCRMGVAVNETSQSTSVAEKILLLPFKNMSKIYGENVNVRCPVCGKIIIIGKIEDGVEHDLTAIVFDLLKDRKNIQVIPPNQAEGILPGLILDNKISWSEKNRIMEAGRLLGADVVIYGYVYRYEERVGSPYAVDSPASVAFDMHLIQVSDGSLLWNGHFDETQQSLSENLFKLGTFIKRKARWISAREMATTGIKEVMKTFPTP